MRFAQLATFAIADDDQGIQRLLEKALAAVGYQCLGIAQTGTEAIEIVRRKKPQLILLDVHMPGTDCMTATEEILKMDCTAVVMITADSNPDLPRKAMDLGATGYVQKPFELTHLLAMMESAWHAFETGRQLRGDIRDLNENLETRKLLEKAKGILMEQQGFAEEAAHKMLQKMSQDQGIALKEVCRSLIQVRMILGQTAGKKPSSKQSAA